MNARQADKYISIVREEFDDIMHDIRVVKDILTVHRSSIDARSLDMALRKLDNTMNTLKNAEENSL